MQFDKGGHIAFFADHFAQAIRVFTNGPDAVGDGQSALGDRFQRGRGDFANYGPAAHRTAFFIGENDEFQRVIGDLRTGEKADESGHVSVSAGGDAAGRPRKWVCGRFAATRYKYRTNAHCH